MEKGASFSPVRGRLRAGNSAADSLVHELVDDFELGFDVFLIQRSRSCVSNCIQINEDKKIYQTLDIRRFPLSSTHVRRVASHSHSKIVEYI
ncbi:hypothetical protein ACJIZ3_019619 [Penstemon smallii]|uniref:Uncharacterized protein n=1 Tax=Penstemon smallii TaxID=265156 RepID=A0ABD3T1U2_9LAMI